MVSSKIVKERNGEEKLKYLKLLTYNIILKKIDKKYYLSIPEISLIAINDNLQAAYEDLFNKKEKLFKDMVASGCEDDIALPRHLSKRNELFFQLKVFVCMLLIGSFIFIVSCALGGRLIVNKVDSISGMAIAKKVTRNMAFQINRILDTSEERREEALQEIKDFLNKVKPIIREFMEDDLVQNPKHSG